MQITPQLPLMGFVARVQETSKWLLAPRSLCMTAIRCKSSPQQTVSVIRLLLVEYFVIGVRQVINHQHQLGQGHGF